MTNQLTFQYTWPSCPALHEHSKSFSQWTLHNTTVFWSRSSDGNNHTCFILISKKLTQINRWRIFSSNVYLPFTGSQRRLSSIWWSERNDHFMPLYVTLQVSMYHFCVDLFLITGKIIYKRSGNNFNPSSFAYQNEKSKKEVWSFMQEKDFQG